jgi:hypothetical protein
VGNAERDATICALHRQGVSYRQIGEQVGVSAMTCQRVVKRAAEPAAVETDDQTDDETDRRYLLGMVGECFPDGLDGRMVKDSRLFKLTFVVDMDRLAAVENHLVGDARR